MRWASSPVVAFLNREWARSAIDASWTPMKFETEKPELFEIIENAGLKRSGFRNFWYTYRKDKEKEGAAASTRPPTFISGGGGGVGNTGGLDDLDDLDVEVHPNNSSFDSSSIATTPRGTGRAGSNNKRSLINISDIESLIDNAENLTTFKPSYILTTLKDSDHSLKYILNIQLPSGVNDPETDFRYELDGDEVILAQKAPEIWQDAYLLCKHALKTAEKMDPELAANNNRVCKIMSVLEEIQPEKGDVIWQEARITLPRPSANNKFLQEEFIRTQDGADLLLLDILIEDSNYIKNKKKKFTLL